MFSKINQTIIKSSGFYRLCPPFCLFIFKSYFLPSVTSVRSFLGRCELATVVRNYKWRSLAHAINISTSKLSILFLLTIASLFNPAWLLPQCLFPFIALVATLRITLVRRTSLLANSVAETITSVQRIKVPQNV